MPTQAAIDFAVEQARALYDQRRGDKRRRASGFHPGVRVKLMFRRNSQLPRMHLPRSVAICLFCGRHVASGYGVLTVFEAQAQFRAKIDAHIFDCALAYIENFDNWNPP